MTYVLGVVLRYGFKVKMLTEKRTVKINETDTK